nr:hypothetical protein [Gemmatimonadaceae bacterium]
PAASRGRVFTADGTGRWTGTPSAAVPANGAVITVYPTMPFGGGTPVGTLTVLDSTVGGLGVAVLTLRNAAGAIVLQGRVTQEAATGRIVTTAAIGGGPSPSARLVDTLEVLANRIAGRITLTATGGEWYLDEDLANESRATAELVARGDTLRAVSVPLPGGLDSTAFRLNGRSLGYFRGDDTLRGAASADATALVAAVVRFAQEVPLPNLLGVAVSSILLIVRDTSVPGLGIAVPLAP